MSRTRQRNAGGWTIAHRPRRDRRGVVSSAAWASPRMPRPRPRAAPHPTAFFGTLLVVISGALTDAPCARYINRAVRPPDSRARSRALVVLNLHLATLLARAALTIIGFADWESPPAHRRATPMMRMVTGRRWVGILLVALLLAGCGQPSGVPTANLAALPATATGCFTDLRVLASTAVPRVAQTDAEARARAAYERGALRPGALLDARPVTVLATEGRPGLLGGRDVWLLAFAASPNPDWPLPPSPSAPARAYALVDTETGTLAGICAAPA